MMSFRKDHFYEHKKRNLIPIATIHALADQ